MIDIVERLRADPWHAWMDEAAVEIERLRADNAKLRAENEKMREMWDETLLRAIPVAAALKETGDE